ncbi:hypothetical protein CCHR01_05154 [Colletotrichum chrysophilum]|uniref:Uncharacterized protein n=1 Tax=Colletotrichum chrysophilum TaxID=1836956 RepID=A0AAD9AR80_9PEZI|nr:hypothetical protein CCHR01_05154 [Colletotrichum chrysophilum]
MLVHLSWVHTYLGAAASGLMSHVLLNFLLVFPPKRRALFGLAGGSQSPFLQALPCRIPLQWKGASAVPGPGPSDIHHFTPRAPRNGTEGVSGRCTRLFNRKPAAVAQTGAKLCALAVIPTKQLPANCLNSPPLEACFDLMEIKRTDYHAVTLTPLMPSSPELT